MQASAHKQQVRGQSVKVAPTDVPEHFWREITCSNSAPGSKQQLLHPVDFTQHFLVPAWLKNQWFVILDSLKTTWLKMISESKRYNKAHPLNRVSTVLRWKSWLSGRCIELKVKHAVLCKTGTHYVTSAVNKKYDTLKSCVELTIVNV